jgi:DNA-binding SARP family transcriptional activator
MDSMRPLGFDQSAAPYELSVLVHLLKRGLEAIVQGRYAEGAALFAVVRANLPSDHVHILAMLDAFLAVNATYQQVEQALQEASARFVEAHTEQRVRVAALATPLAALISSMEARYTYDEDSDAPTQQSLSLSELHTAPLPQLYSDKDAWYGAELSISCFGQFEVRRCGQPVVLCANRKAQAVLRYLAAIATHSASSDTLQALFWPEDAAEVAQHKLHIAMSSLRRSLQRGLGERDIITYKNHVYALNPALQFQVDVDIFLVCYQQGQQGREQIACYERACRLYTGPFLVEDLYADWSSLQREKLRYCYLSMCSVLAHSYLQAQHYEEAQTWATAMLTENKCDETAHQLLIRIYVAQGRRHDAIQQYHTCEQILRQELGVRPLPETGAALGHLLPDQHIPEKKKQSSKRAVREQ